MAATDSEGGDNDIPISDLVLRRPRQDSRVLAIRQWRRWTPCTMTMAGMCWLAAAAVTMTTGRDKDPRQRVAVLVLGSPKQPQRRCCRRSTPPLPRNTLDVARRVRSTPLLAATRCHHRVFLFCFFFFLYHVFFFFFSVSLLL